MKGWQKVFETDQSYHAEIVKDVLEDNNITPVLINKRDSSLNNFGQYEVHVASEDVLRALQIIKNDIDFK
ncbi:hypothetical protein GCM10009122_20510 [Fulvivirga kasyanovii]|uniref:DUF2007 domain-containing protein n=1 Tax=Fulvivirga kasyanovii TaxID=396812 RepID=A0ABW9RSM9_9BACT|nr:DUF2007 domain-containing protein [Fulvivirga kasyanovii]MTI26314.1 hypothetical protein [Fulvivirga kasyanovii]